MQTLNVGAGRNDADYKAAERERRTDLRADSNGAANWFFVAAGVAALGTGLLPVRLNIAVSIGAFDLFAFYARRVGDVLPFVLYGVAATWVVILLALGVLARKGYRSAFLAGIVLYAADSIALLVTFSILAFAVHTVFIFQWFQGQKALKESGEPSAVAGLVS